MATTYLLDEHWFGANLFRVMTWTTPTTTTHQYVPGSSHVKSVALLTARVEETTTLADDDDDASTIDPDVPDIDRPIAAQWSVLYEMEQEFQQSSTATDTILSTADQYREILHKDSSSSDDTAPETKEKASPSSPEPDAPVAANTADSNATKDATTATASIQDNNNKQEAAASSTANESSKRVTETSLVVAVLEAWIQKGKEPFRWRVCHIREAHEFR